MNIQFELALWEAYQNLQPIQVQKLSNWSFLLLCRKFPELSCWIETYCMGKEL